LEKEVRYAELKSGKSKGCQHCSARERGKRRSEAYPDELRQASYERKKEQQRLHKAKQRGPRKTVPYTGEEKALARRLNLAKARCTVKEVPNYKDYGGRGIEFKFETIKQGVAYILSELGSKPSPTHTIDRIDNNGHYERGNLRWATKSEQCLNRRAWKWSEEARLRHYKLRAKT
jgi:hypothetical protein